eukprot:6202627-Pleurochrysis_carterae.AAC.3
MKAAARDERPSPPPAFSYARNDKNATKAAKKAQKEQQEARKLTCNFGKSSTADAEQAPPKPPEIVRPHLKSEELELRAHVQHVAGVCMAAIDARKAAKQGVVERSCAGSQCG